MNKASRPRLRAQRRPLATEALEDRRLLAGDVTNGLVHRWTFDETSGDFAADVVGGNTATLGNWSAGEAKWVTGRFGGGLDFDGVDNFAITSAAVSLNQYTASFWLKLQGPSGIGPRIIAPADGFTGICIDREHGKGIGIFSNGNFGPVDAIPPSTEVWTHFVVVVDSIADTAIVYRNGQQAATGTLGSNAPIAKLIFGHNCDLANQGDTLDGVLDDIRIYDRLLSATEANDLADFGRPVLTAGGTVNFIENGTGVRLLSTATITDGDNANFAGGYLAVAITPATRTVNDRLFVHSTGTGPGEISVTGSATTRVKYGGVVIGTYSGAQERPELAVIFNSRATVSAMQALMRNVYFRVVGDNPATQQRQVEFVLNDGSPVESAPVSVAANVIRVNDAPVLGSIGGSVGYNLNAANSVAVAGSATVIDKDSTNFAAGKLSVRITSGSDTGNRIELSGTLFTINGQNLLRSGVVIGTLNANAGRGLTKFEVTFNSAATPNYVQQLLRALRFRTVNSALADDRVVSFSLTDGDGGTSATLTKTVAVS